MSQNKMTTKMDKRTFLCALARHCRSQAYFILENGLNNQPWWAILSKLWSQMLPLRLHMFAFMHRH